VAQLDRPEMPAVETSYCGNPHPLGQGHHARVHDPERESLILLDKLDSPAKVVRIQGKLAQMTLLERAEERDLSPGTAWSRASVRRSSRGAYRCGPGPHTTALCPTTSLARSAIPRMLSEQQLLIPLGHIITTARESTDKARPLPQRPLTT
jgi:hypothetical protein